LKSKLYEFFDDANLSQLGSIKSGPFLKVLTGIFFSAKIFANPMLKIVFPEDFCAADIYILFKV